MMNISQFQQPHYQHYTTNKKIFSINLKNFCIFKNISHTFIPTKSHKSMQKFNVIIILVISIFIYKMQTGRMM